VLGRRWLALARNESVSNLTSTLLGDRADRRSSFINKIVTRLMVSCSRQAAPTGCATTLHAFSGLVCVFLFERALKRTYRYERSYGGK
jgi:hypothetical protein